MILDSEYCPICRFGQLSTMALMDTLSCVQCNHIFTVNSSQQTLTVVDGSHPLTWQWNGRTWRGIYAKGTELGGADWFAGIGLILFPALIVGITAYRYPPIPNTPWAWFPLFWTGLTFLLHLFLVGSIMCNYYQFPITVYLKAIGRYLLRQESYRGSTNRGHG
jgi:hypothetical protein